MESPIRIFATGGTFDKEYDKISGELEFRSTHVQQVLELGRSSVRVDVRTLMLIDSQDMTDADRDIILDSCRRIEETRIIITHGTDRMALTAAHLGQAMGDDKMKDKTIVLTGAMIPYQFGSSDGLFNFGAALAYVQLLGPGVYVAMNGRYFTWDNVRKNRRLGLFESLEHLSDDD